MFARYVGAKRQLLIQGCTFFPVLLFVQMGHTPPAASSIDSELSAPSNLPAPPSVSPSTKFGLNPAAIALKSYTVQAGDTITAIALEYNLSTQAVLDANPGIEPENLQVDQSLNLPIPATASPSGLQGLAATPATAKSSLAVAIVNPVNWGLGAGAVLAVITLVIARSGVWRRYRHGLRFQMAATRGGTASEIPLASVGIPGIPVAPRQEIAAATPAQAPAPTDWSPSLQAVLDQPPSSLPLRLILGGAIFCLVFGAWSWFGEMNDVGHASGRLVPQGETYKIHGVEAGKVVRIAVKEGQDVKAGQLVVALDSQLATHEVKRLEQLLTAHTAEVTQKQGQIDKIRLEAATRAAITAADVQAQVAAIAQAEAGSATASRLATQYEQDVRHQQERLQRLRPLVAAGVISKERLFEVEQSVRDRHSSIIKSQGDWQQSLSETEQLRAGLAQKQAEGQQAQLEAEQHLNQLQSQILELQAQIAETQTLLQSATSRLEQRFLYAPVDGVVSSLNIHNIGEVIQPGQTISEIAAQGAPLVLKANLPNREAGFVKPGMAVQVKFDAFPYQDYGIIPGRVIATSPDAKPDERLGVVYRVDIGLERDYVLANQQKIQFKPGQTATAEIVIRHRRIVDILLDPIRQLQKGGVHL